MVDAAKILAVDHIPADLEALTGILSTAGYTVVAATTGEEALQRLTSFGPDLILLDAKMPGLNGFETCQKFKANPSTARIPIILTIASSDTESSIEGFSAGAADVVGKPFRAPELLARVKTQLHLRQINQLYELEKAKTEQLTQLNNRLSLTQLSVDSAADGIIWIDSDSKCFYANTTACELLEYSRAELTALSISDIDVNFAWDDWQDYWQKAPQTLREFTLESCYRAKSGRIYPVEVTLNCLSPSDSEYRVAAFRDISDRKAVEAALQLSEARAIAAFEQAAVGFAEADIATQKLTRINTLFCEMVGYPREKLLEITFSDITHPDDMEISHQAMQRLYSGSVDNLTIEKRYIRSDGTFFWAEVTLYLVKLQGEHPVYSLALIQDITRRKQLEAERKATDTKIQQQNQKLEQALIQLQTTQLKLVQQEKMSALGNLVAGIAHEINNPIGFVGGNISELKLVLAEIFDHLALHRRQAKAADIESHRNQIDLDYLLSDVPKMLASMEAGCDRIRNISVSLRTFSRADRKTKTAFNLHEGLDSTLLILKHRLKANEQRPAIVVHRRYGNLPEIQCFPGQLNQVFMNILANAIDALDENSQGKDHSTLEATPSQITITTDYQRDRVLIHIADNGVGIPEEAKSQIFDHLYTTKAIGKGTGLGLAIAQQIIVETHGGQITVSSTPNQGTEFVLTLPSETE
ncbi:MAG: PAS domain S-box protein [Cyanobacteria bacterium P01_H01_bin.26]